MPRTLITGSQVNDETVQRVDLNSTTAGQAVIKKIIGGAGISLVSTGVDAGTGDVTVSIVDSPALTGTPTAPTAASGTNTTQIATTAHVLAERTNIATLTNKTLTSPAITTPTGIVKGDVGLGSVDNTTDATKPVSTAQQTALNLKASSTTNTFTGAQIGSVTALTSATAAMAINLATNNNFSHTTTENTTLSAPSNPVAGQSGVITITQGNPVRTLAYNTFWKFSGGAIPALTAVVGAVDTFAYFVSSATRASCQLIKDVK